ncbi:MAG: hypothetical protein Q8Q95_00900 [bacterium]|nr:hypothetical protein [bacterium]
MPKNTKVKKYKNNHARHSGVILERIEGKIDLLIDQQNGMKESFDVRFDSQDEQIDKIVIDVSVIKLDVGMLKEDMNVVKEDLGFIKSELKKKVDSEKFAVLERKITAKI